jgi:hypothetical protein
MGHFNPYVYKNIETIADHLHFVGKQSAKDPSDETGGGHAHCGLCLYQGENFPPEYRDRPLLGNIHGKRINQENLLPEGSGYRAAHLPDFFKSNDFNFTAVTLKAAPDGSLVFSDWYDRQKCHSKNSEIWDRSNGRLYRVRYEGWKPWKETVGLWDADSTLELQRSPNGWLNRMARRRIAETAAKAPLNEALIDKAVLMLSTEPSVDVRLRIMWWIHATNPSGNQALWLRLLTDQEAAVRQWAIQLGLEQGLANRAFLNGLVAVAEKEQNPSVRLALASALQRMPNADRWSLASPLLQHAEDNEDHNLPQMLWYGIEAAVPGQPNAALALARSSKIELPARLIARRLAETQVPATLDLLVGAAAEAADASAALVYLGPVAEALKGRFNLPEPARWRSCYDAITTTLQAHPGAAQNADLQDVRSFLGAAFNDSRAWPELRSLARDRSAALTRRQLALQMLAGGQDATLGELLLALLPEKLIRLDVLRLGASLPAQNTTTAESPAARFFNAVLKDYRSFTAEEKDILERQSNLKKELYGRFGDSINLES